jgi:hypothetical protein
MSGRATSDVSAARWRAVWRKRDAGTGPRAIGRELGIDESSVRYYLAKGRPAGLTRDDGAGQPARSHAPQAPVSPALNVIPLRRTS